MDKKAYIKGYLHKLAAGGYARSYNPMAYWGKLPPLPAVKSVGKHDAITYGRGLGKSLADTTTAQNILDQVQSGSYLGSSVIDTAGLGVSTAVGRKPTGVLSYGDQLKLRNFAKNAPRIGGAVGSVGSGIAAAGYASEAGKELGQGNYTSGIGNAMSSGLSAANMAGSIGIMAPAALPTLAKFSPYATLAANAVDASRTFDPKYRQQQLDFYKSTTGNKGLDAFRNWANASMNPVSGTYNTISQGKGLVGDWINESDKAQAANESAQRLKNLYSKASPEQRARVRGPVPPARIPKKGSFTDFVKDPLMQNIAGGALLGLGAGTLHLAHGDAKRSALKKTLLLSLYGAAGARVGLEMDMMRRVDSPHVWDPRVQGFISKSIPGWFKIQ